MAFSCGVVRVLWSQAGGPWHGNRVLALPLWAVCDQLVPVICFPVLNINVSLSWWLLSSLQLCRFVFDGFSLSCWLTRGPVCMVGHLRAPRSAVGCSKYFGDFQFAVAGGWYVLFERPVGETRPKTVPVKSLSI